jgi:hypothetical protein
MVLRDDCLIRSRFAGAGAAGRRGERVQADRAGAGEAGPRGGQGQRQEAHRVHLCRAVSRLSFTWPVLCSVSLVLC